MTWYCPECGREECGPLADKHLCPVCKHEMVLVTEVTKEGKKKKVILEKLED